MSALIVTIWMVVLSGIMLSCHELRVAFVKVVGRNSMWRKKPSVARN